ncbi:carbonic anhydrase [Phytohalomonas tamaricis]|uniref:carbonic anhydrase n=1 Tax=Phytohalomonas tamaricis TaxID=2081032 RepID=UPI000D0B1B95|nr:carbonic anhydrase [Phytohalomonas tamaricis]
MKFYERILLENQAWAHEMCLREPGYFQRLSIKQTPDVLWIGCSDSRVPAEQICNAQPGDLFIYRNVANMVCLQESSFMSVLEYAVTELRVNHIIVCGHHQCGGIKAALTSDECGLPHLDYHLVNVRETRNRHAQELAALADELSRINRLVELNVCDQIECLAGMPIIQEAWMAHRSPSLHGMVYALEEGLLREIVRREGDETVMQASA